MLNKKREMNSTDLSTSFADSKPSIFDFVARRELAPRNQGQLSLGEAQLLGELPEQGLDLIGVGDSDRNSDNVVAGVVFQSSSFVQEPFPS